jgi:hypothetical protein
MFKKNHTPWNKGLKGYQSGSNHHNWGGGHIKQSCIICDKVFYINKARLKTAKFCSLQCSHKSKIGKPTWNKGTKGIMKANSGSFKKQKIKNNSKYIHQYMPTHPKTYVYIHRYVMEKHLGRYLTPDETIHHIDGNKSNNHITNLCLYSSKSTHQKTHYLSTQATPPSDNK